MAPTLDAVWSFDKGELKLLWGDTNEDGPYRTYSYLLRKAVPWMIENGVPEKSTRKFIMDNPKRIFSIQV